MANQRNGGNWKKYFKTATINNNLNGPSAGVGSNFGFKNYQSHLPEVYIGHPNRVERYNQYEQMDMDSEVNAALDILAEFSTQPNIENGTAFDIVFKDKPTDNEIKIIREQLAQWVQLNELNKRIFKIFRNTVKYGDQVFLRDPENFKMYWSEMANVTKVIVNENEGKKPEQYVIKTSTLTSKTYRLLLYLPVMRLAAPRKLVEALVAHIYSRTRRLVADHALALLRTKQLSMQNMLSTWAWQKGWTYFGHLVLVS